MVGGTPKRDPFNTPDKLVCLPVLDADGLADGGNFRKPLEIYNFKESFKDLLQILD
jgi:hypothetical protein